MGLFWQFTPKGLAGDQPPSFNSQQLVMVRFGVAHAIYGLEVLNDLLCLIN